jgi:hypothetical protein
LSGLGPSYDAIVVELDSGRAVVGGRPIESRLRKA